MSTAIKINKTRSTLFDLKSVHTRTVADATAMVKAVAPYITNIISIPADTILADFVEDRVILTVDDNNNVVHAKVDSKTPTL